MSNETKPSIDWSSVDPKYKFLARSSHGFAYLFEGAPRLSGETYLAMSGETACASDYASFDPGACDWKDSLVERPKGQVAVRLTAQSADARNGEGVAVRADKERAYHSIDRFLRNNLCDEDYAEYSAELDSLLAAPAAPAAKDAGILQVIDERDAYHEIADDLAAQIAAITDVEIGEHSSANDPWRNAMLAADDFIAKQLKKLLAGPPAPAPAAHADDTARLDFMIEQQCWIQWTNRDGSILQCQVYDQDEDEEYHVLSGDDRYFNTPREAIDAAIQRAATGG